jgi:site-specific recombinase XerD
MGEGGKGIARTVGRYFTAELIGHRSFSPRTIDSYRDVMKLLLLFFRDAVGIPPDSLALEDIDKDSVLRFLDWVESERGCSVPTRNQRLAVIRSFCRFAMMERPDCMGALSDILTIREKRCFAPAMNYLSAEEVRVLLAAPGCGTTRGFRDTVLLSTLYDTAARVQELCDVTIGDVRGSSPMVIVLHGKGSKDRCVPVMDATARLVKEHLGVIRQIDPTPKSELFFAEEPHAVPTGQILLCQNVTICQ